MMPFFIYFFSTVRCQTSLAFVTVELDKLVMNALANPGPVTMADD